VELTTFGWGGLALLLGALDVTLVLGYLVWLARHEPSAATPPRRPGSWPSVDVIVPVRNEAEWIEDKLRNLEALRYPADRLRVWVVDGASTDGTADIVQTQIARDARFSLVRFPVGNKTAQLNAALRRGDAEWVMVTDADARLPTETLELMMAAAEVDARAGVVGAPVDPAGPHALEALHWQLGNYLRAREGRCGCASLVAGPCFVFRRALLAAWPDDVVADDMHVTFKAMATGRRVTLIDAAVTELRTPQGLGGLFRLKFRRAHAYLREVFRFLPRASAMPPPARAVFLWRAAHLIVLPLSLVATAGLALAWVGHSMPSPAVPLWAGAVGGAGAVTWWGSRGARKVATVLALGTLVVPTLLLALLAQPFWRQTATFPKVATARRGTAREATR
jgi:cellulose synthase/poly-beta-1,6-N-acetylglucosamine synthase-like glycosyltransferase